MQDRQVDAEPVLPPFPLPQGTPPHKRRAAVRTLQVQDAVVEVPSWTVRSGRLGLQALLGEAGGARGMIRRRGRLPRDECLCPVARVVEERDEALSDAWS